MGSAWRLPTHDADWSGMPVESWNGEGEHELVFTVTISSYGHIDKVRSDVTRSLEEALKLKFHGRARAEENESET